MADAARSRHAGAVCVSKMRGSRDALHHWDGGWGCRGKEALQRLGEGAVQADLARSYGVSQATISRLSAPSPFAEGVVAAPAR
jgi:hypothetical protein